MTAALFVIGAIAQLGGILFGAGELLGAHKRARDHLNHGARLRDLPVEAAATDRRDPASQDLETLRGALAAAELSRSRVVAALVLLCAGVLITLAAGLSSR